MKKQFPKQQKINIQRSCNRKYSHYHGSIILIYKIECCLQRIKEAISLGRKHQIHKDIRALCWYLRNMNSDYLYLSNKLEKDDFVWKENSIRNLELIKNWAIKNNLVWYIESEVQSSFTNKYFI